jgi:hypothetical protein
VASRTIGRLIRDLVLYSAVGLVCVGVLILVAFYGSRRGEPISPTFLNWIGVGGVMAIVYPTAILDGRAHWSSMSFWYGLTLALLLQLGGAYPVTEWPKMSLVVERADTEGDDR